MIVATPPEGFIGCGGALKTLDYIGVIGNIATPTLFVVGAEDTGAPPAEMRKMSELVKGSQFAMIPNAAHVPCLDNPAGFQAAIADFLGLPH
jgi:3-oxoadipate enol-lactonase